MDNEEDFTDSWTNNHYQSFYAFVNNFYQKWQSLKNSFDKSGKDYIELFGEGIYKESLKNQLRTFSKNSSDYLTRTNGIILGGTAHTDSQGQINIKKGLKNEPHHNFGE